MPEHIILKINSFYCKKLYSSAQIVEDRRFFCDGPYYFALSPLPYYASANYDILKL